MTGKEIASLMRKHKVTIKQLSERMGITQKRIREVRERGLADAATARDWVQAITGKDPGPAAELRGNCLELGACPRVGQTVWALVTIPGSVDYQAIPGVVERVDNIDNKGLGNTYLTVATTFGSRRVNIDSTFTHEPKLVDVEDAYGPTKKWLVPAAEQPNHYDAVMSAVRALATGTLAGLTGLDDYERLDAIHAEFAAWVQGKCDFAPCAWEIWQDAWNAFVEVNPHYQKPETVRIYTSAPHDYDGFGTKTLDAEVGTDGGRNVRLVEVRKDAEEWQRNRYFSGCHSAYDEKTWKELVERGLASEGPAEESKPEPMPSASRVTREPATVERGGMLVEQWSNRLGWNVGPHEVMMDPAGRLSVTLDADSDERRTHIVEGIGAWGADYDAEDAADAVAAALAVEAAESASEDAETVPAAPVDPEAPLVQPLLLLPPNLAALAKLAATTEHARFGATCGVQLISTTRGYRAAATNGRILGLVSGEPVDDAANYPTAGVLEAAPGTHAECVIPAAEWAKAFKAIPKRAGKYKPVLGSLAVAVREKESTLASTDLENVNVLQPRHLDGRFPDVLRVIPDGEPAASVLVDPKYLIDVLTAAAAFTTDDAKGVLVEFRAGAAPIVVRARNGGQEFTGLVVPLTVRE